MDCLAVRIQFNSEQKNEFQFVRVKSFNGSVFCFSIYERVSNLYTVLNWFGGRRIRIAFLLLIESLFSKSGKNCLVGPVVASATTEQEVLG